LDFVIVAAEKVTSLGKDWHRPCLKCEKCGKTLSPGGHAEVGFRIDTRLITSGILFIMFRQLFAMFQFTLEQQKYYFS
jgi:hypothetical protein